MLHATNSPSESAQDLDQGCAWRSFSRSLLHATSTTLKSLSGLVIVKSYGDMTFEQCASGRCAPDIITYLSSDRGSDHVSRSPVVQGGYVFGLGTGVQCCWGGFPWVCANTDMQRTFKSAPISHVVANDKSFGCLQKLYTFQQPKSVQG